MEKRQERLALAGLFAIIFLAFSVLPSLRLSIFASPDETSVMVTAFAIAEDGRAFIPETLNRVFPWVHPRSFIGVAEGFAPVGFLGWPWFLSFFLLLFPSTLLPWIAAMFIASSFWPLYQMLRRYGVGPAWWGTLLVFFTPAFLLYGNRSLFPNAAFLAGALWSTWFISFFRQQKAVRFEVHWGWSAGLGILTALTAAIRPTELFWILPWWIWFGWGFRLTRREVFAWACGSCAVFLPLVFLAASAYGSVTFGYFVREPALLYASFIAPGTSVAQSSFLPYGFHPQTIVKNAWYFGLLLWPWVVASIGGLFMLFFVARRERWRGKNLQPIFLSAWTLFFLLLIYGSGWYTDRIGNWIPSVGNSFLRYLLPVSVFFGWLFAFVWHWFSLHGQKTAVRERKNGFAVLALVLVFFGIERAFIHDDEGLIRVRRELTRYAEIRIAAKAWFPATAIIFSERSDKIFFPAFRAVVPVPSPDRLSQFVHDFPELPLGYFGRPFSQAQKDAWSAAGLEAQELASFGRERLYRLRQRML